MTLKYLVASTGEDPTTAAGAAAALEMAGAKPSELGLTGAEASARLLERGKAERPGKGGVMIWQGWGNRGDVDPFPPGTWDRLMIIEIRPE